MVGVHPPAGTTISYSRQYRRCGRSACPVCAAGGRGHGPYWYAYWREDGRKRSRYIGLEAPPEVRARTATNDAAATHQPVPVIRVQTMGSFAVWLEGTALPEARWSRPLVATLFKCLLSARGHRLGRDQCIELLWPDVAPEQGLARLRATVHRLRQALGDAGAALLVYRHEVLAFDPGPPAWLDADSFEAAARGALAGRDTAACRMALALYTGAYLPDDPYAEWALARREALQGLHVALLLHLAALSAESGAPEEAEGSLRAVLAADRCHEEAAVALMRLYSSIGRPTQALRIYKRLADALREELDLLPGEEARTLARALMSAQAPRTPEAPFEPPTPTNLPARLTSFVGRRQELAALAVVLTSAPRDDEDQPCSLLTLTGPGGCGKTRLALQLADDLLEHHADGVWLVELAALPAAAEVENPRVVGAVARALGLREEAGRPLVDTLTDYLKPKRLLLVLDNCEHVVAACAALAARLLTACRGLRILATSREVLGVEGEQPWPVPPLSLPEPGATVGMLPRFEAVRLFLERARVQRPGLRLAKENAPAIAAICRCVDGLPLAIELAAARVGVLSIEGIAVRLQQSIAVLKGGPRTVPPRQQTLRATLDWSHDLLTGPEQAILRRLSVFAGGCALEAAEIICAGNEARPEAVFDGLDALARKSLIGVEEPVAPGPWQHAVRYKLLEIVRQYGREKLAEAGEELAVQDRHLACYVELAEEAEPHLRGPEQAAWLARLEHEHDNLRAALAWSMRRGGDAARGVKLAGALGRFWKIRGHLSEGRSWLEQVLARGTPADPLTRARALNWAGALANVQAEYERAGALCEEALALYREQGDAWGTAASLSNLAQVAQQQARYEQARLLCEQALPLYRELSDKRGIAGSLHYLSIIAAEQAEYGRARPLCEEALMLYQELGDRRNIANVQYDLAVVVQGQGNAAYAWTLYEEALALQRELGDRRGITYTLNNLGAAAEARGEYRQAQLLHTEALNLQRALGDKRGIAYSLYNLGQLNAARGEWARATRLWGTANALGEAIGTALPPHLMAKHEQALQRVRGALGEDTYAREWAAGRAMPLEQAVAYANGDTADGTPSG